MLANLLNNFGNEEYQSIVSGVMDVIAVKYLDGSFKSSPFHCR